MPIAGLYVGLGTLLVLALAIRVMWLRNVHRVGIGAAGHEDLARAIRAHANAVEYLPLALLMLVLLALEQTRPALLHGFGIALIAGRLLHAGGLSNYAGRSFGRLMGAGLTLLAMLVMAILLVVQFAAG